MSDSDDYRVEWREPARNRCPHCGAEPCLPLMRKLSIWPANSALCQACGLKVALDPGKAAIAVLPIFALIVAILQLIVTSDPVLWPIVLILMALSGLGFPFAVLFWVPLRSDELSWRAKVRESRERVAAQQAARVSDNKR